MAANRQKRPEARGKSAAARKAAPAPGRIARFASSVAAIAVRHPRAVSGLAIFGVVYSFVAANALWYQPGHHPAPMMVTRGTEASQPTRLAASDPAVTTFRIEREDDKRPARAEPMVRAIQEALAARGLYDGAADGVMGPKTAAAIIFFEETEGLDLTGRPSPSLLRLLTAPSTATKVAVKEDEGTEAQKTTKRAATEDVTASVRTVSAPGADAEDPVAGLIAAAENTQSTPLKPDARVKRIQAALSKMMDGQIEADGILGERTRAAIRRFQKHYKMSVDGEPSDAVLKKLKSIGAI